MRPMFRILRDRGVYYQHMVDDDGVIIGPDQPMPPKILESYLKEREIAMQEGVEERSGYWIDPEGQPNFFYS